MPDDVYGFQMCELGTYQSSNSRLTWHRGNEDHRPPAVLLDLRQAGVSLVSIGVDVAVCCQNAELVGILETDAHRITLRTVGGYLVLTSALTGMSA